MTAGVRSVLARQKAMQDAGLTGAPPSLLIVDGIRRRPLVFTALNGGPLNPSYVTHHFQKLLAAAGIERFRLHDLRHGFVSMLFADGAPLEEISRLVGHSSTATTRAILPAPAPGREARRGLEGRPLLRRDGLVGGQVRGSGYRRGSCRRSSEDPIRT
jgi:integrase